MASGTGQPYQAWFAQTRDPDGVRDGGPRRFSQGVALNWQAQHPPLYYLLMAPVYRFGAMLDWRWHMFLLRMASWSVAFAGFAWGAVQTQTLLRAQGVAGARLLIPCAWPLLFPEFFPEFARLTNDALVILLVAGIWSVSLGIIADRVTGRRAVALGVLLAAGLLTKAFFLPITVSVIALLMMQAVWRRDMRAFVFALVVISVCVGPSAAWYADRFVMTGTLSGGNDFVHLQHSGGLVRGLQSHFSVFQYAIGVVRILAQFAWAGTWSFVHPGRWMVAPIAVSALLGGFFYVRSCRFADMAGLAPIFFVVPFLLGLLYHLLVMVAGSGEGMGTPGWYLHVLAAPLSMALAIGWRWPKIQGALAAYSLVFGAVMVVWQLAFFSGCLDRNGIGGGTLVGAACLIDVGHLQAISLPDMAFVSLAFGLAALLAAGFAQSRSTT
jgi:hypothetical protein